MKLPLFTAILISLFLLGGLIAWNRTHQSNKELAVSFPQAFTVIANSCMPCHHRQALPKVIEKTKSAHFQTIEDETKQRIIGALEGLYTEMQDGTPLSFTSEKEIMQFFKATPGEMYIMAEKGVMPPPWAHELMQKIHWPYTFLTPENRVLLLQFTKKYSAEYL